MDNPKVSIIIRTKNEEKYLEDVLKKIFLQNFRHFEVIIVDSGSTDRTLEIAESFELKIIKIPSEKFTYGYGLNIGINNGQANIIVNLSAHAIPADNLWLEKLVRNFKDEKVGGVYGKQLPLPTCTPIEEKYLFETYGEKTKVEDKEDVIFSNSNSAIRKDLAIKYPFDEKMKFAEDIHWAKLILKKGYKIIYEPEAAVFHSHEHNLKQIFNREFDRHIGRLQRGYKVKNVAINLFYHLIKGINQDLNFCKNKGKMARWFCYIIIYHAILFLGRVKGELYFKKIK